MRIVAILATVLLLSVAIYSQQTKPTAQTQETTPGNPVTRKQVLELPPREVPKLTLQQALKIAERFIKKERLDRGGCYLFEAKWVANESGTEGAWRFWWVRRKEGWANIEVIVSLEGVPKLLSPR